MILKKCNYIAGYIHMVNVLCLLADCLWLSQDQAPLVIVDLVMVNLANMHSIITRKKHSNTWLVVYTIYIVMHGMISLIELECV